LIGFIILISGSLIYNEFLVLPFWGLNVRLRKDEMAAAAALETNDTLALEEEGSDKVTGRNISMPLLNK